MPNLGDTQYITNKNGKKARQKYIYCPDCNNYRWVYDRGSFVGVTVRCVPCAREQAKKNFNVSIKES